MKKLIFSSIFLYFFCISLSWASCIQGNCSNGQGTFIYNDGKYVGEHADDLANGQGTFIYNNGHKYVGEFKDDLFNGQGTQTWANGHKYVGEYKDDSKHGQGTYTWPNGIMQIGMWNNNNCEGCGMFDTKKTNDVKNEVSSKKETNDVKNEVSSSRLNSISSDGVYTYYSDNSCTDGGINGKCVTKSALNNVCNKIGTRIASNYFDSPCNGPFYDNEINKLCENNGTSAISSNKTALINNKCVFEFSASGVVNGNSISRNYTCDVTSVYVENGLIHTLSTSRKSCQ